MRLLFLSVFVFTAYCQYDGHSSQPGGYETAEYAKAKYEYAYNKGSGNPPPDSKSFKRIFKIIEQKMKCGDNYVSSPDDQYFMQNYQQIKEGFSEKVQMAPPVAPGDHKWSSGQGPEWIFSSSQVQNDFFSSVSSIASVATTFFSMFNTFMGMYQSFTGAFARVGISYDAVGDVASPEWEKKLAAALVKGVQPTADLPEWGQKLNLALENAGESAVQIAPESVGDKAEAGFADAPRNRPGLDIPPPPSEDNSQPVPSQPYKPSYGQKGPKPSNPTPSYTKNSPTPYKPKPYKPSKPTGAKPYKPKQPKPTYGSKGSMPYKPKKVSKPAVAKPYSVKNPEGYATGPAKPASAPKSYPTLKEDTPYDVPEAAADAPKKKKKAPKKKAAAKKQAKGKVVAAKQKQNVNVRGGNVYTVVKAPRYIDLYVPASYSPEQTAAAYAAALKAAQKDAPENPMVLPPPPPGVQMTVSGGDDIEPTNGDEPTPTGQEKGPAPPPEALDATGYRRH